MTKNEFIQEAALRLISALATSTAFTSEDVASAAKNIADDVWKQLAGEETIHSDNPLTMI